MARFRPTLGTLSGSWAGLTATTGHRGAFIRKRPKPVNSVNSPPRTDLTLARPLQQNRTCFSTAAATWRTLTDAQRRVWHDFAHQNPQVNQLGELRELTGFQTYVAYNTRFTFRSGTAAPLAAPVPLQPTPLIIISAFTMHRTGIFTVAYSFTPLLGTPTNSRVSIFLSRLETETTTPRFERALWVTRISVTTPSPFTLPANPRRTFPTGAWCTLWMQFDWRGGNAGFPAHLRTVVIP